MKVLLVLLPLKRRVPTGAATPEEACSDRGGLPLKRRAPTGVVTPKEACTDRGSYP